MNEKLKNAVDTLAKALREDPDYYMSWQANIAMSIYDALPQSSIDKKAIHKACNDGAKAFLNTFMNKGVPSKP